jgi:hypothetical protein
MPAKGGSVKLSVRQVLAESHIAAVAIAVLLFWSLYYAFVALWGPLYRAAEFLFTAVAILGIPYSVGTFTFSDRIMLFTTGSYPYGALLSFVAAWLLSRWVYGVGPFRGFSECRDRLARRNDA